MCGFNTCRHDVFRSSFTCAYCCVQCPLKHWNRLPILLSDHYKQRLRVYRTQRDLACITSIPFFYIPSILLPKHTHAHTSRKWREEQAEMLAQKDAEEAAALEDLRAQARKELTEWYSRNDDQLNQTKISNR